MPDSDLGPPRVAQPQTTTPRPDPGAAEGHNAAVGGWWITCPRCAHHGPMSAFEPSLADECWCPKCGEYFEVDLGSDEDEGDDDE